MDTEKSVKGLEMKYFILKPRGSSPYAEASRIAMGAYADAIQRENLQLARDLRVWVGKEDLKQVRKGNPKQTSGVSGKEATISPRKD